MKLDRPPLPNDPPEHWQAWIRQTYPARPARRLVIQRNGWISWTLFWSGISLLLTLLASLKLI